MASVPPCILSSRTQRFRTKVYNEKSLFHNAGTSRNILLQIKDNRLLPFTEKEVPKRILRAIAGCWTWAPSERPDVEGIREAEQCAQDRAPMVTIGTTFQGSRILVKFFFYYPRLNPITCSTRSVLGVGRSGRPRSMTRYFLCSRILFLYGHPFEAHNLPEHAEVQVALRVGAGGLTGII